MTLIEAIPVVLGTIGVIWIMMSVAGEEIDPDILARREAVLRAEENMRRRYTNVAENCEVRTIQAPQSGTASGKGSGSAATKKT